MFSPYKNANGVPSRKRWTPEALIEIQMLRIANTTPAGQAEGPTLVAANSIRRIEPVQSGDEFVFRVTIERRSYSADAPNRATVELGAAALLSYAAFRKELLSRFGIHFRADCFEQRRRGCDGDPWTEEVERCMCRGGQPR